jgi:uncharacterized repeat protein (TIGR03987 family)
MLSLAIVLITLALVCYSTGVWAEKLRGELRPWHAGLFLTGLAFDASGTWVMNRIAADSPSAVSGVATGLTQLMAVTGVIALVLMGLHAAWAVVVLARGRDGELRGFHRLSLWVWSLWLVPYLTGGLGAMA